MKAIVNRTIAGVSDNVLRLSQEGAIRPLEVGSNWTQLCVGVRWSIGDDVDVPTGFRIHFGLASAGVGIFGTTGHALFARSNPATAWTNYPDGTCWHNYISSFFARAFGNLYKRVNTAETTLVTKVMTSTNGIVANRMPRPALGVATACFLVFTKGASWTVDTIFNADAETVTTWNTKFNCSQQTFIEAGEALSVSNALVFLGSGFQTKQYTGLSVNEAADGYLTEVVVGATHSGSYLDVSDIMVAKWA